MASPSNLMNFKSPPYGLQEKNILEPHSPSCSNPFENALKKDEKISLDSELSSSAFYSCNTSFKEVDMPFVAPLDLNSSDMLARESLGILPNTTLFRDSLTSGLLNLSIKELLNTSSSPRESLGVLNLSAMDFGRESIGLFNIQNSFLRRKSIGDENKNNLSFNLEDFNFDNIDTGLEYIKKSPLQIENPVPVLILSTSTTQEKINSLSGLNNAFIFPHSRLSSAESSAVSSGSSYNLSCNPYFNSRSLEEPSKISPGFSQKDSEMSQLALAITDPLNDAFRISTNNNSKHSVSQIVESTTGTKNSSGVEIIRKRINSLPVTLNDHIFADIDLEAKILNASSQCGPSICRGGEKDRELDDSVFLEAKRVAKIIEDTSFISDEKSNNSNELMLDATPQPEWPEDLDSSSMEEKAKSSKCDKETILKQVDKMLGMQPVNLEEKLKLKTSSQIVSPSTDNNISQNIGKISGTSPDNNGQDRSDNYSQNISKISRTSRGDNFSENFSKISQIGEEKVIKLVQDVSDLVNENENLSQTQMEQLRAMVHRLTNMLCDSRRSKSFSAEDSGHSSVDDRHLQENKCAQYDGKNVVKTAEEATRDNSEEICQALDLSCRGKSSGEIVRRLSMSTPLKLNHKDITNASGASIESNTSDANKNGSKINYSNASANSCNVSTASRHSNISQNRVILGAGKLKISTVGVALMAKKGPLRAVLPIENMAKGKNVTKVAVTPERKDNNELPFGLCSKKTSTPIQEPKMKPVAASTPANRNSKDLKEANTPLARPKYNRSFSYQHRASSTPETSENPKTRQSASGIAKTGGNKSLVKNNETKLARRNSVTEGSLRKDSESPMRIKRSFSTGKEPKILSALSRVRQNILNSPYYNPRKSAGAAAGQSPVLSENVLKTDLKGCGQELKRLSMIAHPNKPGNR